MICANCGTANDAGRKFCIECAARLVSRCPVCGTQNPPTAKFCGECAAPLTPPTAPAAASAEVPGTAAGDSVEAPTAERRLVSILFADLVGFTTLAEGKDAEDTRELLSRYFELAQEVVGRYGGTVEKFIGDAVMAVWGAPTAHEDDAERAVRAALELVDAVRSLGPLIAARAGVLTGEAAVTLGARNQGMVAGDLVNTAARLQSVARPGTVLVGEATQRAASRAIAFEQAGEQELKGKAAPVQAWRAMRVVAEVGGRNRADSLEAPFVGRDDELRQLKDLFHATSRDQRARLVSVIGPAGIGKSRLAWELSKYLDGLVETVWFHDGRSPAYGEGISFWALGEMVRERCHLLETDDAPTTRAKVSETLITHLPDPDERRWIEPALLALLGIEPSTTGSEQLFAAWRTFFERMAATAPVVLIFEDFHFADAGLIDFVDHLLEWSRMLPIFVVTLSRPELLDRRPDWGAGKRNFTSLYLEPLTEAAMRELLAGLVPGLPATAANAVIARADGIPLYAVETVRMLLAEGRLELKGDRYIPVGDLTSLAVPETLTALIASRLDSLAPEDRALVSDAAVLGQSFTLAGLAAVSGSDEAALEPRLRALVRRELLTLQADPRSPERGQYAFVQALIREVAYNTLAKRDRKTRHLAAARFFEALGSDELAGALAGHYLAAQANAAGGPEADALAAQARVTLKAAADRAVSLGSLAQGIIFLDQARQVTTDQLEVAELLEKAGWAAYLVGQGEVAEDRLGAAVALRRTMGDSDAIAGAVAMHGAVLISTLRHEAGLAMLQPVVAELLGEDREPAGPGEVRLLAQLSRAYFFTDDQVRAVQVADRALAAGERLDLVETVCDLLITRGSALCHVGRIYEGRGAIRAGVDLADERGLVSTALRGRLNLGVLAGDPRSSYEAAQEAYEIARRYGLSGYVRTILINMGSAAMEVGEWDPALRAVEAFRAENTVPLTEMYLRWGTFTFRAWRGEDLTLEAAELSEWARSIGESASDAAVFDLQAQVDYALGSFAAAADGWMAFAPTDPLNAPSAYLEAGTAAILGSDIPRTRAAIAGLADAIGRGRYWALNLRFLRVGLMALEGSSAEALREGRSLIAEYARLGVPWRQAVVTLALVHALGPGDPELRELAGEAREIFARLGAKPFVAWLDEALHDPSPKDDAAILKV